MPKMSSTDAVIYAVEHLSRALQNTAPATPLVTLGNARKEALRSRATIFEPPSPPGKNSEDGTSRTSPTHFRKAPD